MNKRPKRNAEVKKRIPNYISYHTRIYPYRCDSYIVNDFSVIFTNSKFAYEFYSRIRRKTAELVSKWQKSGDLQYDEFSERYDYMKPDGGEGMTKRCDFIYNKEADLVLVDYNCAGLNYDEYVELFYNLREK